MTNFKVGGNAYFEEPWTGCIIGGKILEIKQTEKQPSEPYLVIKIEGACYGTRNFLASKCYPTREEAQAAKERKSEELQNKYREQIKTPADLVTFMYDNAVACCEEYTNWEARAVAKEKAKEFFGLELE